MSIEAHCHLTHIDVWCNVSPPIIIYIPLDPPLLWSIKTMLRTITRAWGSSQANMYSHDMFIAVRNGEWGTDNHLFVMSLVLNRPIFLFWHWGDIVSGATNISSLNQHILVVSVMWVQHKRSDALADLLVSDLISLPNFPLSLGYIDNYHWVGIRH